MRTVVGVACSGGRDSVALLHATARSARTHGLSVAALHVQHGLHPEAEVWWQHLTEQCARWRRCGMPVHAHVARLSGPPPAGDSIEAWARRGRYAALCSLAREVGASLVLLAHHRQDQAETVLLQLLRGAGAAGLAAMPANFQRDGITFARPWLQQPPEHLAAYVRRWRLRWVTDPSNADPRFLRNRLRHGVWPVWEQTLPQADAALAVAARRAALEAAALAQWAELDLARCTDAADGGLDLGALDALSEARRALVLRAWLAPCMAGGVPQTLVDRLLLELPGRRGNDAACWPAAPGWLRVHRGRLVWTIGAAAGQGGGAARAATSVVTPFSSLSMRQPGRWPIPGWNGVLQVTPCDADGLAPHWLLACEARPRTGGEQFQARPGGPLRSLKKQFQQAGIPAWARDGPLLWHGPQLLFVPSLGIDARVRAATGQPQWALRWLPLNDAQTDPFGRGAAAGPGN